MDWTRGVLVFIIMGTFSSVRGEVLKKPVNQLQLSTFRIGNDNFAEGDPLAQPFMGQPACQMITTVRIEYFAMGASTYIRCIGFTYGDQDNNCPAEGSSSANTVRDFELDPDEFIVFASGDFKYDIESIYFKTNKNRSIGPFGAETDISKHKNKFSNSGSPLLYVNGVAGTWVYSLQFSFLHTSALAVSEKKSNEVASETYTAMKSVITDVFQIWEENYCMLPDVARQACYLFDKDQTNMAAQMSCDLKIVLDQVNLLTTASVSLQKHAPRNLLTLKDYDSAKYMEEVEMAKQFHDLLTEIKFGLNTVISVTEDQSVKLSQYFQSTAVFDQAIANEDRKYIQGQLEIKQAGATEAIKLIEVRLSNITGACAGLAVADIMFQVGKLTAIALSNLNPFTMIFGNIDIGGMLDAFGDLMNAIKNHLILEAIADCFNDVRIYATKLAQSFAKNAKAIAAMEKMVITLLQETNADIVQEKATEFIASYGSYSPAVSSQDFVYVTTLLDTIANQGCGMVEDVGENVAGILWPSIVSATKSCIYVSADIAVLTTYFEDTYSLQFELISALTSLVKGQIATSMADRIGDVGTRIDIRTATIGSAIVETKYQAASLARCDILEYLAAGKRPSICQKLLFRQDDIQKLIAYTGSADTSERRVFAYIPTVPQGEGIPTINISQLLRAEYQSLTLPMANKLWMKTNGWLPGSYNPETAFYILSMDMYLPGLKCNETGQAIHTVHVESESSTPTYLYSESAPPQYSVDKTLVKFEYTEPSKYCAGETESFPVRAHGSAKIQYEQEVCVVSKGEINPNPKPDFTFPSLFNTWTIRVQGSPHCTLVEDKDLLDFDPMITFRMKTKDVLAEDIDECWPSGSRCLESGFCQDRLLSYCCQDNMGNCVPETQSIW